MSGTSAALQSAIQSLRSTPPRIIQSPPSQPRRASVALVVRLSPPEGLHIPENQYGVGLSVDDFFQLPWVCHPATSPQILFIRRTTRPSDKFSSHIAFPGGRSESGDTSSHYTALRETWEEIGIDLAEKEFAYVGRLDDREITTSLGKRLLMILSPFVFLQLTPYSPPPDLQPSEISSLHWIPLDLLTPPYRKEDWGDVEIDISSRLSPRNKLIRVLLRGLVGGMKFTSLLLPDEPSCISPEYLPEFEDLTRDGSGTIMGKNGQRRLRLWGLTLGMSLDFLSHFPEPAETPIMKEIPLMANSERPTITTTRQHSAGYDIPLGIILKDPKTPVTVTSTFDDSFKKVESVHSRSESNIEEMRTVGYGSQVDLQVVGNGHATMGLGLSEKVEISVQSTESRKNVNRRGVGPGITAVFPKFSYPDVNLFIWLFSRKYRRLLRQWDESTRGPAHLASSRRVNWSGAALSAFYSAVRHALLMAIIVRALTTMTVTGTAGWYLWKWYLSNR